LYKGKINYQLYIQKSPISLLKLYSPYAQQINNGPTQHPPARGWIKSKGERGREKPL